MICDKMTTKLTTDAVNIENAIELSQWDLGFDEKYALSVADPESLG